MSAVSLTTPTHALTTGTVSLTTSAHSLTTGSIYLTTLVCPG
jgi:hypothetical protein